MNYSLSRVGCDMSPPPPPLGGANTEHHCAPPSNKGQRPMEQAPGADAPAIPSRLTGGLPDRREVSALTDEMKEFIVRGLARYQSPSEVAHALRDTFGVEVSRQGVHRYD